MPNNALLLKRIRQYNGLKQSHIAELLQVTQATVSRYERGDLEISLDKIDKLLKVLGESRTSSDFSLRRLISNSSMASHLICDTTHRLFVASPARVQEWRRDQTELCGQSLWRFATDPIREAEARLETVGWHAGRVSAAVTYTCGRQGAEMHIRPGWLLWERIQLGDGTICRLVTSVSNEDVASELANVEVLVTPQLTP